jgi:hypothetical protein
MVVVEAIRVLTGQVQAVQDIMAAAVHPIMAAAAAGHRTRQLLPAA